LLGLPADWLIDSLLDSLGKYGITGDIALRSMSMLSGGQKSRVVFARMAMSSPHMLLLDEPSNHLDIETIEGLAQSLSVFQGGLLLISHDQRYARAQYTPAVHAPCLHVY
jgi:ATP-binding cassette, subfamily F, member 3